MSQVEDAKKKEKKQGPPPNIQPKPKLSKAERRALQEQQRAAKAAAGGGGKKPAAGSAGGSSNKTPEKSSDTKKDTATTHKANNPVTTPLAKAVQQHTPAVSLVSHLPPYQDPDETFDTGAVLRHKQQQPGSNSENLHPAIVRLGYAYATGAIRGGNARCRHMLDCYAQVLQEWPIQSTTPGTTQQQKKRDLRTVLDHDILKPAFQFWTEHCRPHSVSMGNAFSFLKTAVASLDRELNWESMVEEMQETMSAYARERIEFALTAIAETATTKLLGTTEVILTYGHSEAVLAVLAAAANHCQHLRVIVVDSRPLCEGRAMVKAIAGLENVHERSYIMLEALTYVLQDVTKVLVGAAALMSDGSVTGRAGTAMTCMAAHAKHIPVLVCAETYKISNRVQLESITSNELWQPPGKSQNANDDANVKELHLLYDLTPASYVSGIVTELGIVPPSSVAVLLREMNPQELKNR